MAGRMRLAIALLHVVCAVSHSGASTAATRIGYAITAHYTVPSTHVPCPLPEALCALDAATFPSMSRARKSCRRGAVLINGIEGRCIATARPGDTIALQTRVTPGYTPRGVPPFPIDIAYEDDSIAVVVKPAGVVTHPPPGGAPGSRSMRTAVQYALRPPPAGTPGALYRPHCVHRLDKPTSGLLLCAKTKQAELGLHRAFRERRVHKCYRAIVCGRVEPEAGCIDAAIDGKPATSHWRVLRRARSLKLGGSHLTELELRPVSGRTHQLRIHCATALGAPIVGDGAYGGDEHGSGLYLAALELRFTHPDREDVNGLGDADMRVAIDAPPKFDSLMNREHQRWERLHSVLHTSVECDDSCS